MKPVFFPKLINGPFGDPGVYVDFLFERRAMLFDLGDLRALPTRQIMRLSDVFVSHAHMDHLFGFDWLLRLCLGRDKCIRLFGPAGFLDQVGHRLAGYTWNLVANYPTDFTLDVTEVVDERQARKACFRCRTGFRREQETSMALVEGLLRDEEEFTVRFALLDHQTPCLAFALEEKRHVNIWRNRLDEWALEPGPWLKVFKRALVAGEPPDTPIEAVRREGGRLTKVRLPLGELAVSIAQVCRGQKIAYVTDVVYHAANARQIVALARGADALFIEATFGEELAERAAQKYHLTARQAGMLARAAGVRFPTPFHFSPIYHEREAELREEFARAFREVEASPT